MNKIKDYLVQVYDCEGNACKLPRYFKGTEEEVKEYIKNRFSFVDSIYGRTTLYYETTNEDEIPKKIVLKDSDIK